MRKVFLVVLGLSVAFNIVQLSFQIIQHQQNPPTFHTMGNQFEGLQSIFTHVRRAGYYTDKNTENPAVMAQFEQAQYVLAPTVLVLNKTDYPLVILDCSSSEVALNKIKEFGLKPLKVTDVGLALALNPQQSP